MQLVGWIVRTEGSGRVRYWKVGEVEPDRAARIGSDTACAESATAIAKISARAVLSVTAGVAIEVWERMSQPRPAKVLEPANDGNMITPERWGEITFDVVIPEEGLRSLEGCYRIDGEDWKVYLLGHSDDEKISMRTPLIDHCKFESGIFGVQGYVSFEKMLNRATVMATLSEFLGITGWTEVSGPNSLVLR